MSAPAASGAMSAPAATAGGMTHTPASSN
jgi:hypothetical protein